MRKIRNLSQSDLHAICGASSCESCPLKPKGAPDCLLSACLPDWRRKDILCEIGDNPVEMPKGGKSNE